LLASSSTVVASLFPWVRTGARERSSYELIAAARRLDVLTSNIEHALLVAWRFFPLLVALGWLAYVSGRLRLSAAAALVAGAGAVATAIAVARTPLLVLAPVRVTMIFGGVAVVTAVLSLRTAKEST